MSMTLTEKLERGLQIAQQRGRVLFYDPACFRLHFIVGNPPALDGARAMGLVQAPATPSILEAPATTESAQMPIAAVRKGRKPKVESDDTI